MPELKLYTVKDLREWLENNHPAEGLSERVIAPTRAWAIIHNPYVKDDDAIIAAIFEDGKLAAYTVSFPEMIDGKRIWWCSTLYCYPQYAGHGYGMIVVGALMEAHEPELTYDRWGAPETVEICRNFDMLTTYTSRYHLSDKHIDISSIKGKMAKCVQSFNKCLHPWPKPLKANHTLIEVSTIDDEAYAFMKAHRGSDLWLRERDTFNWILVYPFMSDGSDERDNACAFSSAAVHYEYKAAKIYINDQLQAVYILRLHDDALSVIYLYYASEHRDIIFASIVDRIIAIRPKAFITENKDLMTYVQQKLYFPACREEHVSFSIPATIKLPTFYTLQLGDGDSFA